MFRRLDVRMLAAFDNEDVDAVAFFHHVETVVILDRSAGS